MENARATSRAAKLLAGLKLNCKKCATVPPRRASDPGARQNIRDWLGKIHETWPLLLREVAIRAR